MVLRTWIPVALAATVTLTLAACSGNSQGEAPTTAARTAGSASGTPSRTVTATPTAVAPDVCPAESISADLVGPPDHAAGQSHYLVALLNRSEETCVLPASAVQVQAESVAGGTPYGAIATGTSGQGTQIPAGASLQLQFAVVSYQNYAEADCKPVRASAFKISWNGGPSTDVTLPVTTQVCSSVAVDNVQEVAIRG